MPNTGHTGPDPGDSNSTAVTQTGVVEVFGNPSDGGVPTWNATAGRFEWGTGGSGTSSPSGAGGIITSEVPAGLEFAFWGAAGPVDGFPNKLVIAFRVLVAGDYSWGYEGDVSLVEGFDLNNTSSDADLSAMNVGEYVVLACPTPISQTDYGTNRTTWGFDPAAMLPGAWHPVIGPTDGTFAALAARVTALENP